MSRPPSRRSYRRGYLLMEVMVGGILVGAALMTLASSVSQMRHLAEISAREVTAGQLMGQKVEEVQSVAYGSLGSLTTYSAGAPEEITLTGRYERVFERTLVDATVDYYEFYIQVSYALHHEIRDISTTVRIYDPEP